MMFKIGWIDALYTSTVASQAAVAQHSKESIALASQSLADASGLAGQIINRARALLKLNEQGTNQSTTLFDDCWTLGYIGGLASAAAAENHIGDDVEILGLMTRAVGELAGGGLPNKVTAHEKIIRAWDDSAFEEGSRQGKADWLQQPPAIQTA